MYIPYTKFTNSLKMDFHVYSFMRRLQTFANFNIIIIGATTNNIKWWCMKRLWFYFHVDSISCKIREYFIPQKLPAIWYQPISMPGYCNLLVNSCLWIHCNYSHKLRRLYLSYHMEFYGIARLHKNYLSFHQRIYHRSISAMCYVYDCSCGTCDTYE